MDKPTILTASEFDEFIKQHDFVVVDFWSPTCPPCLMLAPVIDELASKHANVAFAKVNISDPENAQIADRYGRELGSLSDLAESSLRLVSSRASQ